MALSGTGLKTHIWNNNLKSIIVICLYPFFIAFLCWLCIYGVTLSQGGVNSIYYQSPSNYAWDIILRYWWAILLVCGGWFTISWLFHTKMIRSLSQSHPVRRRDEPDLYNLLENLSISAGIPMPRLEIIETHARNAFASGVNQQTFTVTVTRGLIQSLTKDELEAVLAHELTHILNRDVRLLIITIIFTGMIGFAAQLLWRMMRHRYVFSGRRRKGGKGVIVILIIALILWGGYIASLFMRFFISRRREYMADAGAVELTKNPTAMMNALMRISGRDRAPEMTDDIAMMCFENRKPFLGMFATHPPINNRIRMLSKITGEPIPNPPSLPPTHSENRIDSQKVNPWITQTRHKN